VYRGGKAFMTGDCNWPKEPDPASDDPIQPDEIDKSVFFKLHEVTYIDLTEWAPYLVEKMDLSHKIVDILIDCEKVLGLRE